MLAASGSAADTIGGVFGVIGLVVAYWAPSIIAYFRHVQGLGQVVVLNLFLGWTGIFWVFALVMAFRHVPEQPAAPPAVTR